MKNRAKLANISDFITIIREKLVFLWSFNKTF